MSKLVIEGGVPLRGKISIHGAKNAVLPILAATLLNEGRNVIHDCPRLKDVYSSLEILKYIGCDVEWQGNSVIVDSKNLANCRIPDKLMREMRSSVIFLGALLARCKNAEISHPGGCELGPRPIDLHLKAFRELGIGIEESHGYITCTAEYIKPCEIHLSFPSVGATENIMLAAMRTMGTTVITNAAREPEIVDLQSYLNKMGGKVNGAGTEKITIESSTKLNDVEHTVIPDRIVAASYMAAAAATNGEIELTNVVPDHVRPIISVFRDTKCVVNLSKNSIKIAAPTRIKSIDYIRTTPHPGFPTDAQAPIMSALALANGTSMVAENMFENRFKHVDELNKMGADIKVDGRLAVVRGVDSLTGANVTATDLRGAAGLIIAGLAADGVTEVHGLDHLDRGYVDFEEGLRSLGAKIKRV